MSADLPGIGPDEIEISVVGDTLTLSGTRSGEALPEGAKYYRRERGHGEFSRSLNMPFEIDVEAIKATVQNGVLKLELPRLPEEKPKKIAVNSGN